MSGIAAVVNFDGAPVARELLTRLAEQVAYRGRDGIRYWCAGGVGFAHLALNGTPESRYERQPLHSDGLVLAADARIDNRPELLAELRNGLPATEVVTDADLILAAYRRWGGNCAAHLIGDFAFVVWEIRERRLFAARDPLGIRTLHFARFGDTFVVASEAQQIVQHPGASHELDEIALAGWVVGRPDSHRCLFDGVETLAPGHALAADSSTEKLHRYWSVDFDARIRYPRLEDYEDHLIEVLTRCVSDRLRTNTAVVGSELSGGMDSTTVTALAHRCLEGEDIRLVTCTQQFPTVMECDETDYARSVAEHLGLDALYMDASRFGALEYPEKHPPSLESPWIFNDPTIAGQFRRLRKCGVEVVLTGIGGDEVATGSNFVWLHRFLRGDWTALWELVKFCVIERQPLLRNLYWLMLQPVLPARAHHTLRRAFGAPTSHPYPWPRWVRHEAVERLDLHRRYFMPPRKRLRWVAQQDMYEALTESALPSVIGTYDLAALVCGMEARHPFADRRLVEFALAVPQTLWARDDYGKWLLRSATRGLLPDTVRWRVDKTQFGAVYGRGIRGQRRYVDRVLGHSYLREIGVLDNAKLKGEFWSYYDRHRELDMSELYCVMSLLVWLSTHFPSLGHAP